MNPQSVAAPSEAAVAQATLTAVKEAEKRLDAEIEKLENLQQDDLEQLRKKRLEEMKAQQKKTQEWLALGHGTYHEVADQAEWFQEVKRNERVVCHFYRPTTWRCQIVDKHLAKLAAKHLETRFIKINAENTPFLIERLQVVLMPTIVCTKDNFTNDTIEGFTDLGNKDDFTTDDLARRLAKKGSIFYDGPEDAAPKSSVKSKNTVKSNKQGGAVYRSRQTVVLDDDDDDDDEDDA